MEMEQFLSLFDNKSHGNDNNVDFTHFLKVSKVKTSSQLIPLKEYIQTKHISFEDIHLLFENIQKRNNYLTRFYNTSLKYPKDDISIHEKPMKSKQMNNDLCVKYKNVIRNMFFWDILKNTKSGMANSCSFIEMLENLYKLWIIDYKLLTPSSIFYMKKGRLGSVFSSYFFRASIMNPYMVYSLNKSIIKAEKVFTPTLGWGSYYYGFAESGITHYVGTDVIPNVCNTIRQFAKERWSSIDTKIYCSPSENLLKNTTFIEKYRGFFDLIFFSPPYYKLELYEGGKQSTMQYPNYEDWLKKYWEKTIELCDIVLNKNGKLCYILSGYGSENTNGSYDLLTDMNNITKKWFHLKEIQPMFNKNVSCTKHRETAEKIMIFMPKKS